MALSWRSTRHVSKLAQVSSSGDYSYFFWKLGFSNSS
jgi:citrate synthase